MAATESTMLGLGTPAPDFSLPDVISGETISLASFAGKHALLVMFICPHCPFVRHVEQELARLARDYADQSAGIVGIQSNDAEQVPADGSDGMRRQAKERGFTFPYCFDESQEIARAYHAACTPDFFVFDKSRTLVYRGRLDGSTPNSGLPVTGGELRAALDAVLSNEPVSADQKPSIGCNIKWKSRA
jgi:peroxiredoxin